MVATRPPALWLNARWRIVDDGQRWRLEARFDRRLRGNLWLTRRYHVNRDALLRSIAELCGAVDDAAMATSDGGR